MGKLMKYLLVSLAIFAAADLVYAGVLRDYGRKGDQSSEDRGEKAEVDKESGTCTDRCKVALFDRWVDFQSKRTPKSLATYLALEEPYSACFNGDSSEKKNDIVTLCDKKYRSGDVNQLKNIDHLFFAKCVLIAIKNDCVNRHESIFSEDGLE